MSFGPLPTRDLIFLDLETSGLDCLEHEILDLAVVRMPPDASHDLVAFECKTRLQWPSKASRKALEINRYSPAEWTDAVPIRAALVRYAEIVGDGSALVIGHGVTFDLGFLAAAFAREKLAAPPVSHVLDTLSIGWPLVHRGLVDGASLDAMCTRYRIPNTNAHRAMPDVRRTIALYRALLGIKATP